MSRASGVLRVLVVDDHPIMRKGIVSVLADSGHIAVVAEAADGREAVEQYRAHRPDAVLMDLMMPRCGGVEAIRKILQLDPAARILALTTYVGDALIERALDAGALGYLVKSAMCRDVPAAVRAVSMGQRPIDPVLTSVLPLARLQRITRRETDVLAQVAQGHGNREIAAALGISEETVKGYVRNILQKLGARDRTHAVVIALQWGMLDFLP